MPVRPVVCMVTDRRRLGGHEDALVRRVACAAAAGVDLVHIRERDMDARALSRVVARCVATTAGSRTRVLVNDRLDIALTAGAHGVHLRGDSMPAGRAKALAPAGFLIGRSVHTLDETVRVTADGGLDYLLFGTVFDTGSKPGHAAVGIRELTSVAAATPLPVLAIGGVTLDTVGQLSGTGSAGFAAIGLFADVTEEQLPEVFSTASRAFGGQ